MVSPSAAAALLVAAPVLCRRAVALSVTATDDPVLAQGCSTDDIGMCHDDKSQYCSPDVPKCCYTTYGEYCDVRHAIGCCRCDYSCCGSFCCTKEQTCVRNCSAVGNYVEETHCVKRPQGAPPAPLLAEYEVSDSSRARGRRSAALTAGPTPGVFDPEQGPPERCEQQCCAPADEASIAAASQRLAHAGGRLDLQGPAWQFAPARHHSAGSGLSCCPQCCGGVCLPSWARCCSPPSYPEADQVLCAQSAAQPTGAASPPVATVSFCHRDQTCCPTGGDTTCCSSTSDCCKACRPQSPHCCGGCTCCDEPWQCDAATRTCSNMQPWLPTVVIAAHVAAAVAAACVLLWWCRELDRRRNYNMLVDGAFCASCGSDAHCGTTVNDSNELVDCRRCLRRQCTREGCHCGDVCHVQISHSRRTAVVGRDRRNETVHYEVVKVDCACPECQCCSCLPVVQCELCQCAQCRGRCAVHCVWWTLTPALVSLGLTLAVWQLGGGPWPIAVLQWADPVCTVAWAAWSLWLSLTSSTLPV